MARFLKHGLLAAVLGVVGLSGWSAGSAQACEPQYRWVRVTTYELRVEKTVDIVTRYDHCGKPIQVAIISNQTVKVPVQSWVKVRV